jgi:hypothetical protein
MVKWRRTKPSPIANFERWLRDSIAMCKAGAIPVTSCPRVAWSIVWPPLLVVIDCRR